MSEKKTSKSTSKKTTTKKSTNAKTQKPKTEKKVEETKNPVKKEIKDENKSKKKLIVTILIVLGVLALVLFIIQQGNDQPESPGMNLVDEEANDTQLDLSDPNKVIATVNNEPITASQISLLKNQLAGAGAEVSDERALEVIINQELIFQEAVNQGVAVTVEEADQYINTLAQQQQLTRQEFLTQLEENGITEEQLVEEIRRQITISRLQEQVTNDISITDEEVEIFFDENRATFDQQNLTLESSAEDIENFLRQQKVEQTINNLVQGLRESAEVVLN